MSQAYSALASCIHAVGVQQDAAEALSLGRGAELGMDWRIVRLGS